MRRFGCTLGGSLISLTPWINRVLRITIPFLAAAVFILLLSSVYDYGTFIEMAGLFIVYFIPPAGKETIIPAAIALGIPWYSIGLSLTFIDILCSVFMLWNFDLLGRFPIFGPWISRLMRRGTEQIARHAWLERAYFLGLVLFVFFPFQGTGALSGSILGKMAGMPTGEIFLAVITGSALQSLVIGLSAYALNRYLGVDLWYLVIAIMAFILLMTLGSYIWFRIISPSRSDS